MMKYELYEGDTNGNAVAAELEDDFAAESWAKGWVRQNGKSDRYTLRRADGGLALAIFRTNAGQWYLTPTAATQAT